MVTIVSSAIIGIVAIISIVISCRQFREKGFVMNNSYIFASKKEREAMDKKPLYRQSGIVFLLVGLAFSIISVDILIHTDWLFYCELVIIAATLIYAIVSSLKIDKKTK